MNQQQPLTFKTVDEISQGGAYEWRDGVLVRVEEPAQPPAGARPAAEGQQGADAGPGGVAETGAATGDLPAPAEASATRARRGQA